MIDVFDLGLTMATIDTFNTKRQLSIGGDYYSISGLDDNGIDTSHLPYSIRILLEGALRGNDGFLVTEQDGVSYTHLTLPTICSV